MSVPTPKSPTTPVQTDAGTAALAYYRRDEVKQAGTPAPSDLDQMFGYYAA